MPNPALPQRPTLTPARWPAILIAGLIAVGAVAVVLAVVPSEFFDLDRFSVPKELALLGTGLLAGLVLLASAPDIELGIAEAGLLAFLGLSAVSALFATNHWLAARSFSVTLGGAAVFFAARGAAARIGRAAIAGPLVVAVLAGAMSGLLQAYGWDSALLADTRAPGGTLGNRNFMAHLAVIGLPLVWWLVAKVRSRPAVVLSGLGAVVIAAAVVLSRSRAAWVGLGATMVVMGTGALITRSGEARIGRRRLLWFVAALAAGATLALVLPNRLDWKSRSPYRDSLRDVLNYREGSGHGRLIQYRNSLKLVRENPLFGTGPGNWFVDYPTVTTPGDPSFGGADPIPTNPWPSSDWVALVVERGPAAALLWIGTLICFAVVALRRARDPLHGASAIAALGVMTAVSVVGLFDAVLLLAPPTLIAGAALGSLLPATRPVGRIPIATARARWLLGFAAVMIPLVVRTAGETTAAVTAGTGYPISTLEAAVRFDPGNYRLHLHLALREGCSAAGRAHAARAAALLPNHPWPRRLVRRCGGA